jgi:predicted transcriptional regulator
LPNTQTAFENTVQMMSVLVKHCSDVFTQVSGVAKKPVPKNRKEMFLDLLPAEFNRQTYLEVAKSLSINEQTAKRYIRKFVEAGLLLSPYHNQYTKVPVEMVKKG